MIFWAASPSRMEERAVDDEIERAIEEALEGKPRARELAEMIAALEVRQATFQRERDAAANETQRREWVARLREVEKQIRILREEQAITEFVESSVRVTVTRAQMEEETG